MNALTIEWVEKAEGDFATAGRELRARRYPNYDAACLHAQQVAEKYLKAFLQEHGRTFPKTHNLVELLELCLVVDPDLEVQRNRLIVLDRYAVRYRYPGDAADKDEARDAYGTARMLRIFFRAKLGLDDQRLT
jgi:HEPN domain-containing protein